MHLIRKFTKVSGQGLVEFALVLPVLLLLIIGTLDLGSAFFIKVVLENSAREGASYMMYNNTPAARASDFAEVKAAVQDEAEASGLVIPVEDIEVECREGVTVNNACPSGSTVVVRVHYEFVMAINIFSGGPLELTDEARMLIP